MSPPVFQYFLTTAFDVVEIEIYYTLVGVHSFNVHGLVMP